MPAVGTMAPDFELPNQDGEMVKLSDFRGKTVILFAYPKADTPGCTTQACGFRDQMPQIEESNAVVLGISGDSPEAQKKWQEKQGLQYDLLCDEDFSVLKAWGAYGEKKMFGKTYEGIIRSHWVIGPDGVVQDEQISVSPKKSVEAAVKALS